MSSGSKEPSNIRRAGKRVILEPKKRRQWPKGYWKSWGKVPDDFQAPEPLVREFSRVAGLRVEDWL
jgi:hypothetical protein